MRTLLRYVPVIQTTVLLGPSSVLGMLLVLPLAGLIACFRFVNQGYCRFLFSSK